MSVAKIEEIVELYQKDRLIPFIGSGFSAKVAPTWDIFIKDLFKNQRKRNSENIKKIYDNLEKLEYFITTYGNGNFKKGKKKLIKYIDEKLKFKILKNGKVSSVVINGKKINLNIHDLFCEKFKDQLIYTTNWDNLIECVGGIRAFKNRSEILEYGCKKGVIKFHGSVDCGTENFGDELIVCQTDYWKRISNITPFDILFQSDFLKNTFLFIGYSIRDINVSLTIYQLVKLISHVSSESRIIWAVTEYRDDPRINTLAKSIKMKPYFLLNKEHESELKKLDKEINQICGNCRLKDIYSTSTENIKVRKICNNCRMFNAKKKCKDVKKEIYIESGTKSLLEQLVK